MDHLAVHVEREDLGIFPVSVVTLGAIGWSVVEAAHEDSPSFLHDHQYTPDRRPEEPPCKKNR